MPAAREVPMSINPCAHGEITRSPAEGMLLLETMTTTKREVLLHWESNHGQAKALQYQRKEGAH